MNSHSCHPQSRDSQASSSSSDSDSLFAYDYLLSALPTARRTRAVASVETQRRPLETEEADNNDFEELPNGLVNEGLPLARANDVGITGLAETGCRVVDGGWVKSAGDNEGGSSFPAAPTPPTAVLHFKPCNMVVVVTPPSPPTPMRSSEVRFTFNQPRTRLADILDAELFPESSTPQGYGDEPRHFSSGVASSSARQLDIASVTRACHRREASFGEELLSNLQTQDGSRHRLRSVCASFEADRLQSRHTSGRGGYNPGVLIVCALLN